MPPLTAKVFKCGDSQAILLPKGLRLSAKTVHVEKMSTGLLVTDPKEEVRRRQALLELYGSCPDFPLVEPLPLQERDLG